jgi:hypothetical protein
MEVLSPETLVFGSNVIAIRHTWMTWFSREISVAGFDEGTF